MKNKLHKAITKTLNGILSSNELGILTKSLTPSEYKIWHGIANYILIEALNRDDLSEKQFGKFVQKEISNNCYIGGTIDLFVRYKNNVSVVINYSNVDILHLALLGHALGADAIYSISYSNDEVVVDTITKEEAEEMFNNYVGR